jgi:hypothetical protein
MSTTTNFSPLLAPAVPVRGMWRGRLAGWLARMAARRQAMRTADLSVPMGDHLRRDLGLPPGPSHDDRIWEAGGLMWR